MAESPRIAGCPSGVPAFLLASKGIGGSDGGEQTAPVEISGGETGGD